MTQAPRIGWFASEYPRVMMVPGHVPFRSHPEDGVTVGVFAWVNPETGVVENCRACPTWQLGFVMSAALPSADKLSYTIPPGHEVSLAGGGDFYAVFPDGAKQGRQVYASIFDGTPVSGETSDAQPTQWRVMTDVPPGGLAIISTRR